MEIVENNRFLNILKDHTFSYVDEFLGCWTFDDCTKGPCEISNAICRTIMKYNLERFYDAIQVNNLEFTIDVGDKTDALFKEYNNHYSRRQNQSTICERLYRFGFKHIFKYYLKKDFDRFCEKIAFNKRINDLLKHTSSEHLTDFEALFQLFEEIGLNNQDILDVTLSIMRININNGILNTKITTPVIEAHQMLKDSYTSNDQDDLIIKALEYLEYPNIEAAKWIINKRNAQDKPLEKKQEVKSVSRESQSVIDKTTYFDGIATIAKYYNIEDDFVTRRLSMDEIIYVVGVMQSLNFDEAVLNKFLKTAYKKHKSFNPIDRYHDLANKIDYYMELESVSSIDKVLKELVREYITTSNEKDKEFWLNSLNDELSTLESIINRDYTYELRKNKS